MSNSLSRVSTMLCMGCEEITAQQKKKNSSLLCPEQVHKNVFSPKKAGDHLELSQLAVIWHDAFVKGLTMAQ